MKTPITMRIDDDLLADAKAEALRRKTTLTQLVEDAVRAAICHEDSGRESDWKFPVFTPSAPGFSKEFEGLLPSQILALMDEEDDLAMINRVSGSSG